MTILVILGKKVAYLQAGILGPGQKAGSLGEVGHFLSLSEQNITGIVTFTHFYATFRLPGPDSRLPRPDSTLFWASRARFQASGPAFWLPGSDSRLLRLPRLPRTRESDDSWASRDPQK